eukprot:1102268-Rhodomonas_salina.1
MPTNPSNVLDPCSASLPSSLSSPSRTDFGWAQRGWARASEEDASSASESVAAGSEEEEEDAEEGGKSCSRESERVRRRGEEKSACGEQ